MGIDVYAEWAGMTEGEKEAQYTGFSLVAGAVGYLREAYHGEPYATMHLLSEAFDAPDCSTEIRAALLRKRLPATLALARQRRQIIYGDEPGAEDKAVIQSFVDFVELCERKERETGRPVRIIVSA